MWNSLKDDGCWCEGDDLEKHRAELKRQREEWQRLNPITDSQIIYLTVVGGMAAAGVGGTTWGASAALTPGAEEATGVQAGNAATEAQAGDTITVERVMSEAGLDATSKTGLLRGGREGTHFVTDSAPSSATEAQEQLALPTKPTYKVTMQVPRGSVSDPSVVKPAFGQQGGGTERTAAGNVPVKILSVERLKQ